VDLEYEITGITDNGRQLRNLHTLVQQYLDRNKQIKVYRDPEDPSLGYSYHSLEFDMRALSRNTTQANKNNIHTFEDVFAIRSFGIESVAGFPTEGKVRVGGVVDTITVTVV